MRVHLIGASGAGMGALAGLLTERGETVSGSDTKFDPPVGPALAELGVRMHKGWSAEHLADAPDLVVVGNVCRADNPEAMAATEHGLRVMSMPQALEELFILDRRSLVIAGTHGKTTTTSLCAFLLDSAGHNPGFFIGATPLNFATSARIGDATSPMVLEGDEYDSAFFEKTPKFWRYRPWGAVLTSVEHDHIDIYPEESAYLEAFEYFVALIPKDGVLVAWAGDENVRKVCERAHCDVQYYALDADDCGAIIPEWLATPTGSGAFDLFLNGSLVGQMSWTLSGLHNIKNCVASLALVSAATGREASDFIEALPRFAGVSRRQELVGVAGGVHVYDDFAHHPSAVRETLAGLRERHRSGRLIAAFEPRSATASRRRHQQEYPSAFACADITLLAPVGRPEISEEERLDVGTIADAIAVKGGRAVACPSIDALIDQVVLEARDGDIVVLMSNGAFGNAPRRVFQQLNAR